MTAVLALLLCFLLPGIAGGVLLTWSSVEPARPGALLLRGLSCGVAAWLLGSGVLASTAGITTVSSWVTEALLGVASVVVLVLPRSRRVLRDAGGEAVYLAAMVVVSLTAWLPVGILVLRTTWAPLGSTPWYYWSLAQQVADVGHVPATSVEWGTTLPFLADYRLLSTGTAMMLTQGGAHDMAAVQAVVVVSVVLLGCGAALLANALGSGRMVSLVAAAMAVATGIGSLRLSSYRPEGLGLGLTLLTVACFVDWFRRGERTTLVAACLLGVALANVHGIALLVAVVMLVAAGVATMPRHGIRRHLLRVVVSGLALLGSVVVVGLVLGGTASGATQVGNLAHQSGLADPTWDFVRAITGHPPSLPPSNHAIAVKAAATAMHGAVAWVGVAVVVAIAGLVVGLVTRQGVARRTLMFNVLALVGLGAAAALFALGWSSYVPRRTGSQRLVQEMSVLIGPFVACGLACLMRRLGVVSGERWRRAVTMTLVVASCGLGVFFSARAVPSLQHHRPLPSDVSALRHLGVPHDSVVLTNAYTEGYIPQVMQAHGLVDGRAPYTYPRVLARANGLLRDAQSFYRQPCRRIVFLYHHHVSYIVVAHRGSYALGTSNLFSPGVATWRLDQCAGLTRVLATPRLLVYRIGG